jgi:hypothetical protein
MSNIVELFEEINTQRPLHATEEELELLGHLLDRLEVTEAYTDSSSCTPEEYDDCQVEIHTLCDRIDTLVAIV